MNRLKEKKIVLTPQRMAVWEFIKNNKNHPSVDIVYESVKKQFPSISLATVYSVLEIFREEGLLQELLIRKEKACYDPFTEPHHHLFCKACGKIYNIEVKCKFAEACTVDGHKIESVHGYFCGVCNKCQRTTIKEK